ncbi:MAG: AAA family ATPase [Longimicrobiales bacterium]|nr:AAA family ATPase [Longimicrobiales bacterium]
MLHIQLFGGPRIFRDDAQVPLSPHQAAVLAMVFGSDGPALPKRTVLSCLWPDEDPRKARRRLNQLIYNFKMRIGGNGVFEIAGEEIRRLPVGVSTDLDEYRHALRDRAYQSCVSFLEKGFASKAGGQVNRQHEDWIEARAAGLRYELRRQAENHYRWCAREEEWEAAQEAGEALLSLAPSDEACLQRVMEARANAGFPAEAEETFRDFSARNQGTGWTPSRQTKAILDAIQSFSSTPIESQIDELGPKQRDPPLFGRDEERSRLRKTLKRVPRKELRGVLVSGEAGIGKTRLIREVLHGLPLDGQLVLSAESAELEQLIPLNPLIEVFKGSEAGIAIRQLAEPWRTVLFGVMPSHYLGNGPIPEAPHIQPGSVPRRLFEAFFQLLLSMTREEPLILVIEDLQWADETTLTVLEFLVRRWDHGGLQLLLSARSEEVRRNRILGRFLENLRIHVDFVEVDLSDLEPSSSEALIQALATKPLAADNISQLRSLAGGNPYFLIELTLEFLAGRVGPVVTPQDIVSIPVSIRQVLERRLSQLSTDAERVLGALSVNSRPIDLPGLARIAHLSGHNCLSGLDQLHRFRLVSNRGTEVMISHELIRQTVYQGLSTTRRAWLHNRVARHILRTRKIAPADELAVHFHRAGAGPEAKLYSTEAADRAEASGAIPEALRFLRIAREHSDEPEAVADLIGRMGHLHYLRQDLAEATPLLELAIQRFRRQGDQARALKLEVERIDCLAQTDEHLGRDCLEELQLLKTEAMEASLWEVFHEALDVEAHQLDREGDLDGVRSVLDQARNNLTKGNPEAQCKAWAMVALNIYFGSPKEGLEAARKAVAIAKKIADSKLLLYALNRLIVVLHYQGLLHTPEGIEALSEAESRLGTCGDLILKFHVKLNRAVWHLEIGEIAHAKSSLQAIEDLVGGTPARDAQAKLQLNLGELGVASNDFQFAKTAYENAQALITPLSPHFFQTLATAGLGLCSLHDGDLAEARKKEAELPVFPDFWTFDPSVATIFKVRMLLKRRDTIGALALLDRIRESVKHRLVPAWIRLTLEEISILRRIQPGRALSLTEEGLTVAEHLGLRERVRQLRYLKESQGDPP